MPLLTQPLRDEHRELLPDIEKLRTLADSVAKRPSTFSAGMSTAYVIS